MGLFPRDRNLARAPREVELEVRASDFQLPLHEVEIRLDAFLKRALPWRSRTSIQSLIREGLVSVEGAGGPSAGPSALAVELRSSRVLRHGARVVVRIPPELQLPDSTADPGLRDTDDFPPGPPPVLSSTPSESSAAAHSGY